MRRRGLCRHPSPQSGAARAGPGLQGCSHTAYKTRIGGDWRYFEVFIRYQCVIIRVKGKLEGCIGQLARCTSDAAS